jgi:xanthine dehydrogenase molybdenum-binding subunit
MSQLGTNIRRVDGVAKVTGRARFLADTTMDGMAHAAVVRSPYPRALVRRVDTSAARSLPGVLAVLTHDDVAHLPPVRTFADSPPVQRILTGTPQFVGDAVAAVAAESLEIAREAASLIEVDYDELVPVLTIEDSLTGVDQLHDAAPGNLAGPVIEMSKGDPKAALAGCAHVFEDTFTTQRQCAQTIESLACICDWSPDQLTVWTHLDSMFHFRDALAEALGVDADHVTIRPPEALGATFGLKNSLIASLEPLCALLSRESGRPVKLVLSAEESMATTVSRHAAEMTLVTGVDEEGRLVARTATVRLDSGAYGWGYVVALSMLGKWATLYRTENLAFTATSAYTNHIPGGAYRSVGTAQIHFAMECQLDEIARTLDLDPVELRRRNLVRVGDRLSFGTEIRSFGAEECIRRGAEAFGWTGPGSGESVGHLRRGVGMALGMHHSGLTGLIPTPEGSECRVRLSPQGRFVVEVGVIDKGQGALTTLTLVAADALDVDVADVDVLNGGTDTVPLDFNGAEASRTTYVVGRAVADACERLRALIAQEVARRLSCDESIVSIRDGSAMAGNRSVPLADLAGLVADGHFEPDDRDPLPVVGAHFCEVEVDDVSGVVRVVRYVAAQDVGHVINPLGCRGQAEGGIHHGIGYALCEEMLHDQGQPLNPNFMGYKVLMAADMPDITTIMVEDPDPDGGPHGAKAIGTPIIPAVAPAVANAVRDAIGVRIHSLPLSPSKVLGAMIRTESTPPTWPT